jgi:hypothetical protein
LVGELRGAGIDALTGYQTIPATSKDVDAQLKAAAQATGADGALVTRIVSTEQQIEVSPGYSSFYPGVGYYGWNYPGWYGGMYSAPLQYRYLVRYSETTLYDLSKNTVVWTATIRGIDPENVQDAIEDYVETVVAALKNKQLIGR